MDKFNHTVDAHPKSVISYKEYKAWKEARHGASAAEKSTPVEEEDWDAEPSLPPLETPPGASLMATSQEDELKQMIDQDPCLGSITGDLGHGTMTATRETESTDDVEELTGTVGGVNESASGNTSQMLNGEMMTHCLCSMMIMLQSPRL